MTRTYLLVTLLLISGVATDVAGAAKIRNGSFEATPLFPAAASASEVPDSWVSNINAVFEHRDLNSGAAPAAFPCPGTLCAPDGRQVMTLRNNGLPDDPSALFQPIETLAEPGRTYTFTFVQLQQNNINGEGAGVSISLWQGNPAVPGRIKLAETIFPATQPGVQVLRRATLDTGSTTNPSNFPLFLRLAHAPGFGLPGKGGLNNVVIDDIQLYDPDADGLEGAEDRCPRDPVPFEWTASTLPRTAGFPRDGSADGPDPGVNLDGQSAGVSANYLNLGLGVIPTGAQGGPVYFDCLGGTVPIEHIQDIAVIGDRLDGLAHYAATHSQDFYGHVMVFQTLPGVVDDAPNEHHVSSVENPNLNSGGTIDPAVRDGRGEFYRKYDPSAPEGPYNHPGDMARLGDYLLVAAQNWSGSDECGLAEWVQIDRLVHGVGGVPVSSPEPDAILFYDVSDPAQPEYRGKILTAELPLPPGAHPLRYGEFATLRVAEVNGFVYMFVADDNSNRWFRSNELSWHADDWTPVTSAEVDAVLPLGFTYFKAAMEQEPLGIQTLGFIESAGSTYRINNPPDPTCTDPEICPPREHGISARAIGGPVREDFWVGPNGRSEHVIANGLGFVVCDAPGGTRTCFNIESHSIRYEDPDNPVQWPYPDGPPRAEHPSLAPAACAAPALVSVGLNDAGDDRVTRDHGADLDWLDLTETLNLSINDLLGGSGGWIADGWSIATEEQVCLLVERATGGDGSGCSGPIGDQRYYNGSMDPATFDRAIAMLGITDNQVNPGAFTETTPSTNPATPSWGAPERMNAANGACGPDAQSGVCAARGIHEDDGSGTTVTTLNRGLNKCATIDTRQCMDGIALNFPQGSPSTCLKCAALDDTTIGSYDGDTRSPDIGVFLVRDVLEPALTFGADGDTLNWADLGAANSYDVYRGDLSSLGDGNGDGLADAGYGDCRNDLDPDITDTTYVDTEVPAPGEGFFYLIVSDTESNLGSSSSGLFRQPEVPCL